MFQFVAVETGTSCHEELLDAAISTLQNFKALLENRQGLPGDLDFSPQELDAIISKIQEAL